MSPSTSWKNSNPAMSFTALAISILLMYSPSKKLTDPSRPRSSVYACILAASILNPSLPRTLAVTSVPRYPTSAAALSRDSVVAVSKLISSALMLY